MEPAHLITFQLSFFFSATVIGFMAGALDRKSRRHWFVVAVVALACLGVVTALGSSIEQGQNLALVTLERLSSLNRPHTVAAGLGLSLVLPWALALPGREPPARNGRARLLIAVIGLLGTLASGSLIAARNVLSPYLPHPEGEVGGSMLHGSIEPGFILETVAATGITPIRIAVDADNRVFVSGQMGVAAQSGAIVELVPAKDGGKMTERIVASGLNRPYGMAFHGSSLYVSRSGQHTRWKNGQPENFRTGAVTRLQDLTGDGVMDFYHDVVAELPGSRGPDYLHQNNAIAFGPDGALYITSGISSDTHPPRDEWEGTILRAAPPDFEQVEVFAKGLRNTFGLAFGPDGELFATDNDANSGRLGNTGDKFVHVEAGDHFGHPYADSASSGVKAPLLVSSFALGGIAYADSPNLPEPYRGSMYVASVGEGRILRYQLEKEGASYTVKAHPFALVPGAVDVAAAPNGDLYVATYAEGRIARIRYVGR